MKNYTRLLLTAFFCCLLAGANAQWKDGKRFQITYSNEGKPVPKGTPITVKVKWDTQVITKIVFDQLHVPTPEEVKNGQYTFVFRPEKTIRYRVETIFKSGKSALSRPLIVVLDKNGVKMKEESFQLKENDEGIFDFSNEWKAIFLGDSVIINMVWDTKRVSEISLKDVYTPTAEEKQKGRYTLVVKPKKTITYHIQYKVIMNNEIIPLSEKIVVLDQNGKEIE